MAHLTRRRIFFAWPSSVILFCSAVLFCGLGHAATPTNWKDSGYSLNADGMSLKEALSSFSEAYGVNLSLGISGHSVLKKRLSAQNGTEFLDRLALAYRFRWFVYNDVLYITALGDQASLRLDIGESLVPDAKNALTGIGLFEPRFGWGELPAEGAVVVTGPRAYVDLVKSILLPLGKRVDRNERTLMVFRLRYASAIDREVRVRDKAEMIPGVKTILSGLIQNQISATGYPTSSPAKHLVAGNSTPETRESPKSPLTELFRQRTGKISSGSVQPKPDLSVPAMEIDGAGKKTDKKENEPAVLIQADASQNAIIIYDSPEKRDMYQAFINELDTEPKQIEIEAVILDVTRSALSELGAEWSFSVGNLNSTVNSTGADSLGNALPISASSLLIKNTTSFYARLMALENKNVARILGRPTVLTIENIAAILDLSTSRFVPVSGQYFADLANVTAGTMLRVVPRLIQDGDAQRIRMDINIENGDITGQEKDSTNVKRDTVSTQAIIEPNHTLLIGGMQTESKSNNRNRIPFLSDIPFLGKLFENYTDNNSTRERLFLITPRLVNRTTQAASARSVTNEASEFLIRNDSMRGSPE